MNGFNKVSLRARILLSVGFACMLCAAVAIAGFTYFNRKELENGIITKERTIQTQLVAATAFVAKQGGLKGVSEKFTTKYKSSDEISTDEKLEILNQVPIFSALVIGKQNAEADHYQFRVFSDEPRKKENLATLQEMEIFKRFAADPANNEIIVNDGEHITNFRPVRLNESQGCLTCHGNPNTSPWKNGKDILGFKMENWKDGKLHGVFAITQNIDAVAKASTEGHMITPAGALIGAILLGALIAILFAAFMVRGPVNALNQVASMLSEASSQVNAASLQIATSAQQLAEATTEQASALQETAASIEEMSSMVTKNSENAKSTARSSQESGETAERGKEVVGQMTQSMDEINQSNNNIMNQINRSNAQMAEIVAVIQEIGTKTQVINDIVFQTKLLSFNASVEAARAGEHGKGFAVVAEEVGNLAQMSGNAAKEISTMLDGSMKKVEAIVQETKAKVEGLIANGKVKVEAGTEIAHQCSGVLNEIAQNVETVSGMASEISTASQEQASGIHELTKAMNQLDQVTQQNASTSEATASSAEELSAQAGALNSAVNKLLETIRGGGGGAELNSIPTGTAEYVAKPRGNVIPFEQSTKLPQQHSPEPQAAASGTKAVHLASESSGADD